MHKGRTTSDLLTYGEHLVWAIAFLFVFGCSVDGADLSQLDGRSYTLEVDRIANNPDVQFPSEMLEESAYEPTDQGNRYSVSFSESAQTVTVAGETAAGETAVMIGKAETAAEDPRRYEIEEGLSAGGRFIVWVADNHFQAELTVYGSGVPIVRSERGTLVVRARGTPPKGEAP
jgi:hypothetical protein